MTPTYTYHAIVRRVIDGDTLRVDWDLGANIWLRDVPLRLLGVDAPELRGQTRQAGIAARDWLVSKLPEGTAVTIRTEKGDSFGRYLAVVWLGGENVNDQLVQAGHAWAVAG